MKKYEKIKKISEDESKAEEKEIKVGNAGIIKGSDAKEKFLKVIEAYKLRNPIKYEHKKAALEKQLASIK